MITRTEIEIEIGMTVKTIQQTITEMEEVKEENTKDLEQVKDTMNEFCNYCDRTGHTTHRCFKLVDYLKRKGKKIILHEEEDVQELAQALQT